ncbi:MAG: flagellar hook-associated protein FlgK [Pseudomonadota bacterium]
MPDLYGIATSGLRATQSSLSTVGNNIANANTDGYHRQRVEKTESISVQFGSFRYGTGVQIDALVRAHNEIVSKQLRVATSDLSRHEQLAEVSRQVSDLFGEEGYGLDEGLSKFFNDIRDATNDPSSVPLRTVVLESARSLAHKFQGMDNELKAVSNNVESEIRQQTSELNRLTDELGKINQRIHAVSGTTAKNVSPDLLDERDRLLHQISERVNIHTRFYDDGAVNVTVQSGHTLVNKEGGYPLQLEVASDRHDRFDLRASDGGQPVITEMLQGGTLGALLHESRDVIDEARDNIGRLAVGLSEMLNAQHRIGVTPAGDFGGNFFDVGEPNIVSNLNNTGLATIDVAYVDATALRGGDYTLSYDGANWTFASEDGTSSVSGAGPTLTLDGLELTLGGTAVAGDTYLVQPTNGAAARLTLGLNDASELAASLPVRAVVDSENVGNGRLTGPELLDVTDPGLRTPIDIVFNNPATSFDLIDTSTGTTVAAAQPYTPGDPIDLNGWRVRIDATPQAGDRFVVEDNAGGTAFHNLREISDLQVKDYFENGTASVEDLFQNALGEAAGVAAASQLGVESQRALHENLSERLESEVGVDLDQEAADLLRFQQHYQANARVLTVAQDLFNTILGAMR